MSRLRAAVVAATGAVGQRFVERLHGHPGFETVLLAASERSVGRPYREAAQWLLEGDVPAAVADLPVVPVETLERPGAAREVDVVFSALPGGVAGPLERRLAAAGHRVFTNARDLRLEPDVPLLVPEVNPDHLALVERQHGGFVVANGNCSGIILTLALAPLHRAFGIEEAHVTTMQGLSGAGYPGVSAMDVVDNVLPFIPGEEEKLGLEPQRTLGLLDRAANEVRPAAFPVHATCTRVPVREGHFESVHLRLGAATDLDSVRRALASFRGPPDVRHLPSAPERPIHVRDEPDRPQPRRDRDAEDGMAVSVGRLRLAEDGRTLRLLVLGHNTVRGAAGQSVMNAEYAAALGRL